MSTAAHGLVAAFSDLGPVMERAAHAAADLVTALAREPAPSPLLPPHLGSSDTCRGCYARCEVNEAHNPNCFYCSPHGPGAARQVAETLAAAGAHSHLVADGQTVCLSGGCDRHRTPAEVLL